MSIPSCMWPQRMPNPETTGPFTGQIKPCPPELIGPAGRAPVLAASCSAIFWEISVRSPSRSSCCLRTATSVACCFRRAVAELRGAPIELHPRRRELLLARGDLVARRPDGVDGDLHLVPQLADAGDDVVVLVLERPHVLGPRHEVVEAVRLEQHRDQVRLVRLVDRDQALLEDLDRLAQALLQHVEPGLGLIELRLLLSQLRGHRGLAVTQDRDLRGEQIELRGLVADPRREDAGVRSCVRKLVLCDVELLLKALARRAADGDRAGAGDQGAAERQPKTLRSSHLARKVERPTGLKLKRRLQLHRGSPDLREAPL